MDIMIPALAYTQFDWRALLGLSGTHVVIAIVNYLKDQWRLSGRLAPLAALLVGVILNQVAGYFLQVDPVSTVYSGLITGFAASGWFDLSKPPVIIQNEVEVVK